MRKADVRPDVSPAENDNHGLPDGFIAIIGKPSDQKCAHKIRSAFETTVFPATVLRALYDFPEREDAFPD